MRTVVGSLSPRQAVDEVYLLQECNLRTARNGKFYLHLKLSDNTGSITGRLWNATEALYQALAGADFARVRGRVEVYQDSLQFVVDAIRAVPDEEVHPEDFLPATERDVNEMFARLVALGETVLNPHLRQLLDAFLGDEEMAAKIRKAPAAVTYHQPYLGGLLEHTLSVTEMADYLAGRFPQLDRDLFITGSILHDVGKVAELSYRRVFEYTDRGRLVGHLIIGVQMVQDRVRAIDDFPEHLFDLLCHLILSHHGEYEWGSPKLPMTPEAIALHHLDNLDAKIEASTRAIETDRMTEGNWTEYSRMFQRMLYKGPGTPAEEIVEEP